MSRASVVLGMLRSIAIYDAIPFRARRLARLYAPFVRAGSLCFDVGAHTGSRTRCWRALGARVVAVEPQAPFAALLGRRFRRDDGVVVETVALGAAPGRATLLVSERTPTVTSLSRAWVERVRDEAGFSKVRWEPGADVVVDTLDGLIARHGLPAFVKIDVEGFEAEVLAGLSQAVAALSFEVLPAAPEGAVACLDRLAALGDYRFNWSVGESHRLAFGDWLDAPGAHRFVASLGRRDRSGDLYARLARG